MIRGLDISPSAHPALTIEMWLKVNSFELPGRTCKSVTSPTSASVSLSQKPACRRRRA